MNTQTKVRFDFSLSPLKEYFLYGLIYIIFLILAPHTGLWNDVLCWTDWCVYIHKNGLENVYHSYTDYPPLYHYILSFFAWIKNDESSIRNYIYELKYITLLFEFCSIFILFGYIKKELRPWIFLFVILNPGFFYNNIIWGQVDGIFSFLILSSIILAINRKNTAALFLFILGLTFKVQAIIFFPLLLFILIHNFSDYKSFAYALCVMLSITCFMLLIISPFIYSDTVNLMLHTFSNAVDKYPAVSLNAYNWWYWFFDGDLTKISDTGLFLHISYKTWGLVCFFIASVIALIPVFTISIYESMNKNKERFNAIDKIFLAAALITIVFFFFNTQMHERYSHYALIFLGAYFAVSGNYIPFLLLSIAYFLNLEAGLMALNLPNYKILLFNPRFVAGVYFILMAYLYYLSYKGSNPLKKIRELKLLLTHPLQNSNRSI
jgi:Gpi18-like mannosyltransferase